MIPFNIPPYYGTEINNIIDVIEKRKLSGDGLYTQKCGAWLLGNIGGAKAFLTTSATHALEMAALLCALRPGDEVIMPSYTFVSTANAFVLRGAKIVFIDIRPDTMNMDETLIEAAITERTKVIVPVHYAGVACEMDTINALAAKYKLFVTEDAAQAIHSSYKGRNCGQIGDFGCLSFHETKNVSCGEGGALIVKDERFVEQAEIIREKGTNRSKFFRGEIDKYSWVEVGSSYLPSELNAAYLYAELEHCGDITRDRTKTWNFYNEALRELAEQGEIELPHIPAECKHNAHMFYIKCKNLDERTRLISFLKSCGVHAVFHYVPLHSADAGLKYSRFNGYDRYTTAESERLLRLPLYYKMSDRDRETVVRTVREFYARMV